MPIFEYHCRACNHRFEIIVLSAREKIVCPKCESGPVDKQLSVFSAPGSGRDATAPAGTCSCTPQSCGCH